MFSCCPLCKGNDIWQISGKLCYRCDDCGAVWGKSENKPQYELSSCQSMYGTFYGNWAKEEMVKLEEDFSSIAIESRYQNRWFFFKGKCIFTAWREGWAVGNLISGKSIDKLIDLINFTFSKSKEIRNVARNGGS
jgi:hypothetical protein